MDLPKSEYLDDDFMMEQTIKPKRKSIAKKKQAPPIKLGKYSLTSDVVNEMDTLRNTRSEDDDLFELVEVLDENRDEIIGSGADLASMYEQTRHHVTLNETYNLDQSTKHGEVDQSDDNMSVTNEGTGNPNEDMEDGVDIDIDDDDAVDDDAREEDAGEEDAVEEDAVEEDAGEEDAGDEDAGEEDAGNEDAGDDADVVGNGHNDVHNDREFAVTEDEKFKGQKVQFRQNKRILEQQADMKKQFKEQIKELDQKIRGLLPKFPTEKLSWPIADHDALKQLEDGLRKSMAGLEEGLKGKMLKATRISLIEFVKENLRRLFGQVGRFTWTGSIPKNAKHGEPSYKASGLACIEALIECCAHVFGDENETIEKAIKKGLEQNNEAQHKNKERRRQELNRPQHKSVSKLNNSNDVASMPASETSPPNITSSGSSLQAPTAKHVIQGQSGLKKSVNSAAPVQKPRLTSSAFSNNARKNSSSATLSKTTVKDETLDRYNDGLTKSIISTSSVKKPRLNPTSSGLSKNARMNSTSAGVTLPAATVKNETLDRSGEGPTKFTNAASVKKSRFNPISSGLSINARMNYNSASASLPTATIKDETRDRYGEGLTKTIMSAASAKKPQLNPTRSVPSKSSLLNFNPFSATFSTGTVKENIQGQSGESLTKSIINAALVKMNRSRLVPTSATSLKIALNDIPSSSTGVHQIHDQFQPISSNNAHSR